MFEFEFLSSWDAFWQALMHVWNIQISDVDGRPLTIGKLLIAIFVFVFGVFAVRFVTMITRKRVYARIVKEPSNVATLQTLTYYVLLAFLTLFSLSIANIPLTVFTVLGGALAIGVGFGSQNIVNNFISGIILMFDRPMKVTDFVEIQGTFGQVQKIGFRSTQILSFGNRHLIFPNSNFLQNDFVNWTLLDRLVRFNVSVGVAYGSDVEKVTTLLKEAANEHPRVMKKEEPTVIFRDFGDNSLVFDLYFTIRIQQLADRRLVESELRYNIDRLFRENDVVISFPQRDVHLDNLSPIEVKMIS